MPTPPAAALFAALALTAIGHAQVTQNSRVTFSLAWQESDAAGVPLPNPNGTLEPGEHALLSVSVSFTNQFTVGSFSPPVGTFTSGTITGFGAGFIDLSGTSNAGGNAQGAWNVDNGAGFGAQDPWNLAGPAGAGTPINGGARLQGLQFLQFPQTPQAILTTNPIPGIWRGLWTPGSFAPRTVRFDVAADGVSGSPYFASLLFATGPTTLAAAFFDLNMVVEGSVQIPIVPAPASLFALTPLLIPRRRHRGPRRPLQRIVP